LEAAAGRQECVGDVDLMRLNGDCPTKLMVGQFILFWGQKANRKALDNGYVSVQ
jgi:hypothetical protein